MFIEHIFSLCFGENRRSMVTIWDFFQQMTFLRLLRLHSCLELPKDIVKLAFLRKGSYNCLSSCVGIG